MKKRFTSYLRMHFGFSQDVLANILNVSRSLIANWEAGNRRLNGEARELVDKLHRIADQTEKENAGQKHHPEDILILKKPFTQRPLDLRIEINQLKMSIPKLESDLAAGRSQFEMSSIQLHNLRKLLADETDSSRKVYIQGQVLRTIKGIRLNNPLTHMEMERKLNYLRADLEAAHKELEWLQNSDFFSESIN